MLPRLSRAALALALAAPAVFAQDLPCGSDVGSRRTPESSRGPAHLLGAGATSSPFTPPVASDIQFVVNSGGGLDTGCTFRSGGPLLIDVPIDRYLGPVDANGFLIDATAMRNAGLLSEFATLILPVFDIDNLADVTPPDQPEIDRVSFNDAQVGFLSGLNGEWKLNSFQIPIERLKFPAAPGVGGARPAPAMNRIRIDIDVGNEAQGKELWCMSADWVAISFKAISPVILIHGNNSNGGFWDRQGFTARLTQALIPFDNSISMPTSSVAINSVRLFGRLREISAGFGVDSVHLVCHSKGGLDTRAYLQDFHFGEPFRVLSVSTCSSPHNGSSGADLLVAQAVEAARADKVEFSGFPTFTQTLVRVLGVDAGTPNLTTRFTAQFNAQNVPALPQGIVFNTVGGDADTNNSLSIDTEAEIAALRPESASLQSKPTFVATTVVNRIYQILRTTSTVEVRYRLDTGFFGGTTLVAEIVNVPTAAPVGNDTLVTIPSAMGAGTLASRVTNTAVFTGTNGRNHSNIANGGVADTILPWILQAERQNGDLK